MGFSCRRIRPASQTASIEHGRWISIRQMSINIVSGGREEAHRSCLTSHSGGIFQELQRGSTWSWGGGWVETNRQMLMWWRGFQTAGLAPDLCQPNSQDMNILIDLPCSKPIGNQTGRVSFISTSDVDHPEILPMAIISSSVSQNCWWPLIHLHTY